MRTILDYAGGTVPRLQDRPDRVFNEYGGNMSKLQVLLATMHQQDFSIASKMNICCDAVIANQADRDRIAVEQTQYGTLKMITTATRGVGLNRNIALLFSDSEFILFSDDDVRYNDGMPKSVLAAFRENPKADVLIFGIDIIRDGEITEKRHFSKIKRLHVWNAMRYGAVRIAARRDAVMRVGITFNQYFGGGCIYSAGEDSLFLKACFDRGLRVYAHNYVLGTCCKDTSSWFVGYDEKYFYDKGVLVRHLFPRIHYLMAPYFAVRFKRETNVPVIRRLRLVFAGVHGGRKLQPYQEGQ